MRTDAHSSYSYVLARIIAYLRIIFAYERALPIIIIDTIIIIIIIIITIIRFDLH